MDHREVREYLPAYADQAQGPRAAAVEEHLRTCGDCRAVLEQYRELEFGLGSLAETNIEPPAWLLGTLIETVSERATRVAAIRARADKLSDPRVVAGGAVVAGVAGALLLRGMRRRRRTLRQRVREALAEA
ncbi:MAG: anti-sigma factor family protein [Acidimicrobiia bacterium]